MEEDILDNYQYNLKLTVGSRLRDEMKVVMGYITYPKQAQILN